VIRLSRKPRAGNTVRQNWRAELPADKLLLNTHILGILESAHVIFSIALNEAIGLRRSSHLHQAREHARVSGELCVRFADALENLLTLMERHAQNFGTVPAVEPLNPDFFHGPTARKSASVNSGLSSVLFSSRSRFFHKMRTLGEMASNIGAEYQAVAANLSAKSNDAAAKELEFLSTLQFDLTTALGEATVVLKSFLTELPTAQLASFQNRVMAALTSVPAKASGREAALRREWNALAGEPCAPGRRRV
jgi:hypothetical protein